MSDNIPEDLRDSEMGTYGTYQSWHFEDLTELFDSYEDGLECGEWIEVNKGWLDTITTDYETQREIYEAINAEDFRAGSCGGCI